VVVYLADLQQDVLVPFLGSQGPALDEMAVALGVDTTLAGRAYQQVEVLTQDLPGGRARVWLPLLDGSDRLGVLSVTVADPEDLQAAGGVLLTRLRRFASMAAELVMTNMLYGDTLVRLRRRGQLGLAAEMQWALLPPLTFACHEVTVAAAMEPAYEVAGDTVDYAVDAGCVRVGVLDGMGHWLQSAQLASLAVAAYRNARRGDRRLTETAQAVDAAVFAGFDDEAFTTACWPSSTPTPVCCRGSTPATPSRCCYAAAGSSRPCTSSPPRRSVSGWASISSAVLVQMKGWARSFQPSMKARILALRSLDRAEGAASDGLAVDDAEPDFDEVEPGALATRGDVYVAGARQGDLMTFLSVYRTAGGEFDVDDDGIRFWHPGGELAPLALETDVHQGFMTDWQQPLAVALTQANGLSILHETVYETGWGSCRPCAAWAPPSSPTGSAWAPPRAGSVPATTPTRR